MSSVKVFGAAVVMAVVVGTGGVSAAGTPTTQVLFSRGTDGYDCFRIPALLRTTDGTLLAFAEARKPLAGGSWCADAAPIDTVVRRSHDGGRTWSASSIVLGGAAENATRGNPEPILVEHGPHRGRIVLLTTYNPAGGGERIPYVQFSDNDGRTWSSAKSLRPAVDDPNWGWFATGPAHGIQLQHGRHAGRLVAGVNYDDADGLTHGAIIYSDDSGVHWHIGADAIAPVQNHQFGELTVFQTPDGTVTAVARNKGTDMSQSRLIATSTDGGSSFATGFQSVTGLDGTPGVQGASLAVGNSVLFSEPVDPALRKNMTVFASADGGATWHSADQVTTDRSGYSDMTLVGRNTIGLLYEAGSYPSGDARDEIRFTELDLRDLS
jgi:sialidase-1